MDEDIAKINSETTKTKIINFFVHNKKKIITSFSILILLIFTYFTFGEINKRNKIKIADRYNNSKLKFISENKISVKNEMIEIIAAKDKTYSPLALYFLLDNDIVSSKEEVNNLFNIVINDISLDEEIKNLIIYKKALYNSEFETENNLLNILNPIINSDSIWKSHSLFLLGEYFLSKNEKKKSKEFFEKILTLGNANPKVKLEAQRRIQRDLSE